MSFLPSLSPGNVKQRLPTGFKFDNDLTYDRPTGWLDLGINAAYGTTSVPEKIKGLVAVYPNDVGPAANYVALKLNTSDSSHLLVDWGDGNPAETGYQSDFSSDTNGFGSTYGITARSGSYEGKSDVLIHTPFASNSLSSPLQGGGRVEIQNTSVDILSGNNYTITFEYHAASGYNSYVWATEDGFSNRPSISTTQAIVTGAWSSGSLFVSGSRPSSSSIEDLRIRPQRTDQPTYGVLSDQVVGQKLAFKNIKVVLNNSGSGYYVKENTTNHHVYDYDIITGDTSTTKSTLVRGYKQTIFEVSLQGSAKLSVIDFDEDGPFVNYVNTERRRGPNILDLFVSSSNANNFTLNYQRPMRLCEQIEVRNTSSNRITTPRYLYQGCRSLQSIPFVPWVHNAGTRDYLNTFGYCNQLKFLPDEFASQDKFWFKNMSRAQDAFVVCQNLQYLPEGLFGSSEQSSCNNFFRMFSNCIKLRYIPYLGMRTGSGTDTEMRQMFTNCHKLTKIPEGFSAQRVDNDGLHGVFEFLRSVKDFSSAFDGTTDIFANINNSSISMVSLFRGLEQLNEFPFVGQFTKCSNANNLFLSNRSLHRFSSAYTHIDLSNATNIKQAFGGMDSIEEFPEIKVRSLTSNGSLESLFANDRKLTLVKFTGMIAGPANGEYFRMFLNCHSLICIDGVDFSFAGETSDYAQMFQTTRSINSIKFPGTHRKGATRIIVTVANHSDISGEYHITADGTGYAQASGNGVLTVAENSGNYIWTIKDSSDNTPTETSAAESTTQYTPWDADWSGATNAVTFTEVETGFKYTVTGNSGDGLRYSPITRERMLEIFNQLVTISHSATLDIRNNTYTADLTDDDKAIATNKGWTLTLA